MDVSRLEEGARHDVGQLKAVMIYVVADFQQPHVDGLVGDVALLQKLVVALVAEPLVGNYPFDVVRTRYSMRKRDMPVLKFSSSPPTRFTAGETVTLASAVGPEPKLKVIKITSSGVPQSRPVR